MRVKTPLAVVASVAMACSSLAADWPQFMGPDRNSTSPEKRLLRSWPENGPEILWTVPVGRGYGGPVVKEGTAYLLDRDDDVGDTLRSFDLSSGDELPIWGITQCPLVYGDLLIVASQAPEAGVVAYDKLTGAVKWKTPSLGYVGYVSPAIVKVDGDDHVVMVTPSTNPFRRSSPDENKMGTVVGIEPLTGRILWEEPGGQDEVAIRAPEKR